MIRIVTHTPVYVWLLLAYLVWGGYKSKKPHTVSWKSLLIMPAIMFAWSAYASLFHYEKISIVLWATSISIGLWLGSLTVRKIRLKFDKEKSLIQIDGNWTPMILSMSIFGLRYFLGATYECYPELKGSASSLILENIATVVSAMFSGRLLGFWHRSKVAPHEDLSKPKMQNPLHHSRR